jgi:hypothetical protein
MPAIDHSIVLHNWIPLCLTSEPTVPSPPESFDSIFLCLQTEFARLSAEEKRIESRRQDLIGLEYFAEDARMKMEEAKKASQQELEKSQREREVVQAQWEAAVKVEEDNENERHRLEGEADVLKQRNEHLERRGT